VRGRRPLLTALALLLAASAAAAAPPEEAIIPLERYTTDKGRALGDAFAGSLRQIYERVSHCRPWLEVQPRGLGFTRAVGVPGDDRYLHIWVWVDQTITPEFAALGREGRASAMFSRHGVDLLRQLAADAALFAHPGLYGYSVILTWIKPNARVGNAEVTETLGVSAPKGAVEAFLSGRIPGREFVERARIVAFDGRDRVGPLPLEIVDDDFATTYKVPGLESDDTPIRC
jgi:hypothetical protein